MVKKPAEILFQFIVKGEEPRIFVSDFKGCLVNTLLYGQDPTIGLARQSLEMMTMEQLHASF